MSVRQSISEISADAYENEFAKYGGSFASHPKLLKLLKLLSPHTDIVYLGIFEEDALVGAIPTACGQILTTMDALKAINLFHFVDIGHSEVILPFAPGVRINLAYKAHFLSELTASCVLNSHKETSFGFAMAKGIKSGNERLAPKNVKNRSYEMRRLVDAGASFVSAKSLGVDTFIAEYQRLFITRRHEQPKGFDYFKIIFENLWDLVCGDVLMLNNEPIAIEILYKIINPTSICVNYVNSAVNLSHSKLSPGSVLLFHNLSLFENEAMKTGKNLRFCMGTSLAQYKKPWSYVAPCFTLDPSATGISN